MRIRLMGCLLAFVILLFSNHTVSAAEGGITSHVPIRISQITDDTLRMALEMYSPNYDSLAHQSKVAAYVNIYKSLYNNSMPPLTPDDSRLLSISQAPVTTYAPQSAPRYEPWQDPYWHPMQEKTGVLSGWHW